MTIYAVGDIQGCLDPLLVLLKQVDFQPGRDTLWSTGDIVNRGPQSLETLRFCHQLGDSFRMVLGNHDLHLIALAQGYRDTKNRDTLDDILRAPDREQLIAWLQHQPLMFSDEGFTLVHAGIPSLWSISKAQQLADEVAAVLQGARAADFLRQMYGNEPARWRDDLKGSVRWRTITNYLTRMRFCDADSRLDLVTKEAVEYAPPGMAPWFHFRDPAPADERIIFGHWAALEGRHCGPGFFPLDTGCVWGGRLRLMRLDTHELFHCSC